jgi:hypothetical protein
VQVEAPSLPTKAQDRCRALVDALPAKVDDQDRRKVSPDGVLGAAWGDPAIVLTCTTQTPKGYGPESSCTVVDGVDWYIPDEQMAANGGRDLTMTTLFRDVDVRVHLPKEYFPPAAVLADLAPSLKAHTRARKSCL